MASHRHQGGVRVTASRPVDPRDREIAAGMPAREATGRGQIDHRRIALGTTGRGATVRPRIAPEMIGRGAIDHHRIVPGTTGRGATEPRMIGAGDGDLRTAGLRETARGMGGRGRTDPGKTAHTGIALEKIDHGAAVRPVLPGSSSAVPTVARHVPRDRRRCPRPKSLGPMRSSSPDDARSRRRSSRGDRPSAC
jgi:hypothetical protein